MIKKQIAHSSKKSVSEKQIYLGRLTQQCKVGLSLLDDVPLDPNIKRDLSLKLDAVRSFISLLLDESKLNLETLDESFDTRYAKIPDLIQSHVSMVEEALDRNKYARHYQKEWRNIWGSSSTAMG